MALVVEPGPRTIVEHVVLAGLGHTRAAVVEREMVLRPGEPFSFERVLESQRRLSGLGIFERVSIAELDPERERPRDVVVSVQEAPRTTWSWGVGYSEQDRLRGSVELTRRNLGGLGRTASVFARGSFRGSRFLLNLREPWLFGRKLDSFLTAFWEEENRTSFDYNRKGGIVQAGRSLDARTSLILRYLYQDTNVFNIEVPIEEIDRQYRTYTVSGPSVSVVFDTRDDPLDPKRGLFLGSDLQLSLRALGGVSYLRGFFQATGVRRLRPDLVVVLSARAGLASTFGDEAPLLPLPERFFAGGTTARGASPSTGSAPRSRARAARSTRPAATPSCSEAPRCAATSPAPSRSRPSSTPATSIPRWATSPSPTCAGARASACATARPLGPSASTGATSWIHGRGTTVAPGSTCRSAMRSSLAGGLVLAFGPVLAAAQAPAPARVEIVERVVAVVDERPLLLSDLRALRPCAASEKPRPSRPRSTSGSCTSRPPGCRRPRSRPRKKSGRSRSCSRPALPCATR